MRAWGRAWLPEPAETPGFKSSLCSLVICDRYESVWVLVSFQKVILL